MRILAIDGGGVRGLIPAVVLSEIERRTTRPISSMFDLVVGTSTGGILALALTAPRTDREPLTAAEVAALYMQRARDAFPLGGEPAIRAPTYGPGLLLPVDGSGWTTGISRFAAIFGGGQEQGNARYPAKPLEALLVQIFGDRHMSEALVPVMVVSCDLDTAEPVIFRGGGLDQGTIGDAPMVVAGRATSAGPSYFQPQPHIDRADCEHRCADGGLVANDPSIIAVAESISGHRRSDMSLADIELLVSVGTGMRSPESAATPAVDQRPWHQVLDNAFDVLSAGAGHYWRSWLQSALGPRYIRLQCKLSRHTSIEMDDSRPQNIEALAADARRILSDRDADLVRLTGALTRP